MCPDLHPKLLIDCILPETVSSMSACICPCLLLTKHWYIPLSAGFSLCIVKFPPVKLCLSVHIIGLPLKNHVYRTEGIPKETQGSTTVVFDPAVVSCGFVIHSGFAR